MSGLRSVLLNTSQAQCEVTLSLHVRMAEVLSWHKVSPHKRILLSKRLSLSTPGSQPSPSLPPPSESGDLRRNKIFPADCQPDCDQVTRLKDVLSFSYSLGDSDIGTSLSRDLSSHTQSSRQSSTVFTKSSKSSRKQSRSSLLSVGNNSINSAPKYRDSDDGGIYTIECVELTENGQDFSF